MSIGKGMTISHIVLLTTTHLEMSADLLIHTHTHTCMLLKLVSINHVGAKTVRCHLWKHCSWAVLGAVAAMGVVGGSKSSFHEEYKRNEYQ